jgi:hypothetical protein
MPFLSTALAVGTSLAATGAGLYENKKRDDTNKKLVQQPLGLQQQYANKQLAESGQLDKFLQPFMDQGSPYYKQQQAEMFNQLNQQFRNQSGQAESRLNQQGFGQAPSGLQAALAGEMGQQQAQSQASSWLQQLLNNQQLQFQAAGMKGQELQAFSPGQIHLPGQQAEPGLPSAISAGLGNLGQALPKTAPAAPTNAQMQTIPLRNPVSPLPTFVPGNPGLSG